jgi:hypothetical protein
MRDEEMLAEIEDFIEGFNQPTYRGMRVINMGTGFLHRKKLPSTMIGNRQSSRPTQRIR